MKQIDVVEQVFRSLLIHRSMWDMDTIVIEVFVSYPNRGEMLSTLRHKMEDSFYEIAEK